MKIILKDHFHLYDNFFMKTFFYLKMFFASTHEICSLLRTKRVQLLLNSLLLMLSFCK